MFSPSWRSENCSKSLSSENVSIQLVNIRNNTSSLGKFNDGDNGSSLSVHAPVTECQSCSAREHRYDLFLIRPYQTMVALISISEGSGECRKIRNIEKNKPSLQNIPKYDCVLL